MLFAAAIAALLAPPAQAAVRADSLARYGVGLLRIADERPKSALAQFEASAQVAPGAAAPRAALVPLYRRLGRPNAAVRVAREVLALDPADAATATELAELEIEARRPGAAVKVLLPFAAPSPPRPTLLALLARAAESAQDGPALQKAAGAALAEPGLEPPARARWLERLGRARELQADPRGALAAYGEAAQLTPGAESRARLAWHRSGVFLLEKNDADALAELQRVLALKPSSVAPYERYAEVMRRLKREGQLAPALERLSGENPKNEALRWLAAAELGAADRKAGLARFRELLDAATEESPCGRYVEFCRDSGSADELLDALDSYSGAARSGRGGKGPRGDPERQALGRLRALVGAVKSTPGVAGPLLAALQARPARLALATEDTRNLVALLAERAGRFEVLEQVARQSADAGAEGAIERLLAVLEAGRNWRGVLELCDRIDRGGVPGVNTDYYRAGAYYELGDEAAALAALDAAAPRVLDATGVQLRRATMLTGAGRSADAIVLVKRILAEAQPPKIAVEAELHLGSALGELGRHAESDEAFERALALAPDSALVLNNYGYHLAETRRRLEDAEAMLRRAVEISEDDLSRAGSPDPVSGSYGDSLGWVLFQRGKYAEARSQLERAAGTAGSAEDGTGPGSTDGVVFDHLGDVYLRLNEPKLAVEAYRRAEKLYTGTHQGREKGRAAEVRRKIQFVGGSTSPP